MTRSSLGRLLRWAMLSGHIALDTTPVGMAAFVKGYQRGRARRMGLVR